MPCFENAKLLLVVRALLCGGRLLIPAVEHPIIQPPPSSRILSYQIIRLFLLAQSFKKIR